MAIYSKAPLEALVDLINQANPNLPFKLNTTQYTFGAPVAITGANGNNTRVKITPKRNSGYVGSIDLDYRRIDLANLFRSVNVNITRYMPPVSNMFGTTALIPLISQKYGINLTVEDIVKSDSLWRADVAAGTTTNLGGYATGKSKTFTADAKSYFYTGSFPVVWNQGQQELGVDILTVTDLAGRQWPSGNDFSVDRTMQAEFLTWDVDFTENALPIFETIAATATGNILGSSYEFAQAIVAALNSGTALGVDLVSGSARSLLNARVRRVVLPSAAADDQFLTRQGFNRALVLTSISWAPGRLVMYYNV